MASSESTANNRLLRHPAPPRGTTQPLTNAGPTRVAIDHSITLPPPSIPQNFNQLWNEYDWNAHDNTVVEDFRKDKMLSTGNREATAIPLKTLRICQPCLSSSPSSFANIGPHPSSSITTTVAQRRSKEYTNNIERQMLSMSTTSILSTGSETTVGTTSSSPPSIYSSSSFSTSSKPRNKVRWNDTMIVCGHKYTDIRSNGRHVSYTGQVHSTTQVPHGMGTLHFADGRIFHGEWHHGKLISLHNPRPQTVDRSRVHCHVQESASAA